MNIILKLVTFIAFLSEGFAFSVSDTSQTNTEMLTDGENRDTTLSSSRSTIFTISTSTSASASHNDDGGLKSEDTIPSSYVIPGGDGGGLWGPWGEVSPCSRSCGGGVASQTRSCLEVEKSACWGGNTKYFSCNIDPCPEGAGDFREEQCADFNHKLYGNSHRYVWDSYIEARNPCELNCVPRGETSAYTQRSTAIDGTRCYVDSFDVCVNGTCRAVGCDMMLGSDAREDKCLVCRGDGRNCITKQGVIDNQDFAAGYNDILLIPQGAQNILIEELKSSQNHLELRSVHNSRYYMGNYESSSHQIKKIEAGGAIWIYERLNFAAPDKLRCRGPITDPLYLMLLLKDVNVGIKYEYSIRMEGPHLSYAWESDKYTPCSANCGGGLQVRNVTCQIKDTVLEVDDSFCDENIKPEIYQACNTQPCAPRWATGPWGPCSKTCGEEGTRSRQVHCEKVDGNGLGSTIPDEECLNQLGPQPKSHEECNIDVTCPSWFTGPWTKCDKPCGGGTQTRKLMCAYNKERFEIRNKSECLEEKPPTQQTCNLHFCYDISGINSFGTYTPPSCQVSLSLENCVEPGPVWYLDQEKHECVVHVNAASGNICRRQGTYTTREDCERYCKLSQTINKQDACSLPFEMGNCDNHTIRWFFNKIEKRCRQSYYSGCGGNDNNFESIQECESRCITKQTTTTVPTTVITTTSVSTAGEAQTESCVMSSVFGCCRDGETPAHGPDFQGCCLMTAFGCCPDNYKAAEGPHLEGCECNNTRYGCCPDNVTIARGANNEGCHCKYSQYGCCPDGHTEAKGPNFKGCHCKTYQFGCCPDGHTVAKGSSLQGCDWDCQQTENGCCGDGTTHAQGPNQLGCDCASSKFGCCPDGVTDATGPHFLNCTDVPENQQAVCSLAADKGICRNYTIAWYFDMEYGGCSRFWYGGCEGNGNRFNSKEECEDICRHPSPKDACKLPKVRGSCKDRQIRWYYNSTREQCSWFEFSGCLGNTNNFESIEKCQKQCETENIEDRCNLPTEQGTCAGNFMRWSFNPESGGCEQFIWGGCEGNSNRFSSEAACLRHCNPLDVQKSACRLPQESGNCTETLPVWSFSVVENRCLPFYYTGCGGNDNRFDSEATCAENCPRSHVQEAESAGIAGGPNAVVTGEMGRPLNIHCLAYGFPPPSIYWYRNGTMLFSKSTIYEERGNILQIRNLTHETAGEYLCEAYNGIGKPAEWTVNVQINRPDRNTDYPLQVWRGPNIERELNTTSTPAPEIDYPIFSVPVTTRISLDRTKVRAGTEINIPCEVDGYPVPEVYWTKDSMRLVSKDRMILTDARLTISGANTNDSGVYGCHASNSYSSHTSTVQITVEGLYIPAKCTDNPIFANCTIIVQAKFCKHLYFSSVCCKTCVVAGQLNPLLLDIQAEEARRKNN